MDNFKLIYKILKTLEKSMDYDEFDADRISPDALNTTIERRNAILYQLAKDGYIEGCICKKYVDERYPKIFSIEKTVITIKGLEYLQENSLMKKIKDEVKGIVDIIK